MSPFLARNDDDGGRAFPVYINLSQDEHDDHILDCDGVVSGLYGKAGMHYKD